MFLSNMLRNNNCNIVIYCCTRLAAKSKQNNIIVLTYMVIML